jgi:valyl-tRNA synthetase
VLTFLARLDPDQVDIVEATEPLEQSASVVVGDVVAYLPLAGMVDLAAERARLQGDLEDLTARIAASEERLAGPFAEKAPPHIVERERERLAERKAEAAQVREQIARLG